LANRNSSLPDKHRCLLYPLKADIRQQPFDVGFGPILLQKSVAGFFGQ